MGCLNIMKYTLLPEKSFEIVKNCSGCGSKVSFSNTQCFRVNANGKLVDVWLIYQCKSCKHTWNLTIHERKNPKCLSNEEFEGFMNNDKKLAFTYGTSKEHFKKNRAEIDWDRVTYTLQGENGIEPLDYLSLKKGDIIKIHNKHQIKVRIERILSELFHISRSQIKKMMKNEVFIVTTDNNDIMIEYNGCV